jgi:hypothetical protein
MVCATGIFALGMICKKGIVTAQKASKGIYTEHDTHPKCIPFTTPFPLCNTTTQHSHTATPPQDIAATFLLYNTATRNRSNIPTVQHRSIILTAQHRQTTSQHHSHWATPPHDIAAAFPLCNTATRNRSTFPLCNTEASFSLHNTVRHHHNTTPTGSGSSIYIYFRVALLLVVEDLYAVLRLGSHRIV